MVQVSFNNGKVVFSGKDEVLERRDVSYSFNKEEVREVVINEGIKEIGEFFFMDYINLTSVTFPNSVIKISSDAFYNCKKIEEVVLGNKIKDLSFLKDVDSPLIKKITVSIDNPYIKEEDNVLYSISGKRVLYVTKGVKEVSIKEGVEDISELAFFNCSSLKKVTLPVSLKRILNGAFYKCIKIEEINIPEGVEVIKDGAFYYCDNIKNFVIPSSLKEIGENALPFSVEISNNPSYVKEDGFLFDKTKTVLLKILDLSKEEVVIPSSVLAIAPKAFVGSNVVKVIFNEGLLKICRHAFHDVKTLCDITLSSTIKEIEGNAFTNCNIANLVIPKGELKDISWGCFSFNENLETVNLHSSLISHISPFAFASCPNLKEIKFNNNINEIERYAFYKCKSLKEVVLPDSLKILRNNVFDSCSMLEKVGIPENIEVIEEDIFANCPKLF